MKIMAQLVSLFPVADPEEVQQARADINNNNFDRLWFIFIIRMLQNKPQIVYERASQIIELRALRSWCADCSTIYLRPLYFSILAPPLIFSDVLNHFPHPGWACLGCLMNSDRLNKLLKLMNHLNKVDLPRKAKMTRQARQRCAARDAMAALRATRNPPRVICFSPPIPPSVENVVCGSKEIGW